MPGTSMTDTTYKDHKILDSFLIYTFWGFAFSSVIIWAIMCVKDTIDSRREEQMRKAFAELQE